MPVADGCESEVFRQLTKWCEFALVIAPEFDGILEERCRWAAQAGAILLGPSPDAVALCADKLALAQHWQTNGVPTPPAKLFDRGAFVPPMVVKPRDGAGSNDTVLLSTQAELERFVPSANAIVQPYYGGTPMSLVTLIGPGQTVQFVPCFQRMEIRDGHFDYRGGSTCHDPNLANRARNLAARALRGIEGLAGYVGVDFVLGPMDAAIEINPRLTTSYIGLRRLCQQNLMEALIDVTRGNTAALTWRNDRVDF